jgi:serine/threonine protein kinase
MHDPEKTRDLQTPSPDVTLPPRTPGSHADESQSHHRSQDIFTNVSPILKNEIRSIGRYRVEKVLGEGGFGVVYMGYDGELNRWVAIKVPQRDRLHKPEDAAAYLAEARVLASLDHPHIVPIFDMGRTEDGLCFVVSKLIDGSDLAAKIKLSKFPFAKSAELVATVGEALHYAHTKGLVHRDIKPGNLLIDNSGKPFVADFGLALKEEDYGKGGGYCGTPAYMSPEQASGDGHRVDGRSDVFSLGVVLYELLTGRRPFRGDAATVMAQILMDEPRPLRQVDDTLPKELERICLKALSKRPSERYSTAKDMADDLRHFLAENPSGGTRGVIAAEPFSMEKLKTSDVVLNYAAIDDYPLQEGKPGWVSQLHRNLEVRMEQLSGEKIHIARLPEEAVSPAIEAELLQHVPNAKAMISVVSPPFLNSDLCRREVEKFWLGAEHTGGRYVKEKSRLLKVLKTAISEQQMPRHLVEIFSPLLGFEFFELDSETGRVREFDETFGPVLKQRFFERVYDLAYDGCQVLSLLKQAHARDVSSAVPNPQRKWVYLATTTSDIADERDRIMRELLERGHVVLPEAPLPMLSRDVETVVRDCLAKCSIAIHLLGKRYGVTPEDSSESIPALQVRLTADRTLSPDLQRLIWLPGGGESADERQRAFVLRVQEDPLLHHRAEIIEGNLNLLKKDLIRRLAPPEEKPITTSPPKSSGGAAKLYLICDPKDEAAVEALEDYLFAQGLEVMLPAFDGDDADAAALHQDNLLTCNGVLVYYGAAPKAWVDIKLRELLKATGYGRETPIPVQAVYIAPPDDRRKERFQSHQAVVIRQPGKFEPSPELKTFISQIKEVCS